jgi:MFS family permease
MENNSNSLITNLKNPFVQISSILLAMLIINLINAGLQSVGFGDDKSFPWTLVFTFLFFYSVSNAIVSLSAENREQYLGRSIVSYLILAVVGGLMAWLFSGMGMEEAGSFRWLYKVFTFGYLLILTMILAIGKIVEYAQKEEWKSPKSRKRN